MTKKKKDFPNPSQADSPFHWTPTEQYPDLIKTASENYGLKFTANQFSDFEKELSKFPRQPDSLFPVSVAVWPSGNEDEVWDNLNAWLIDRAKNVGVDIGLSIFDGLSLTKKSYRFQKGQPVLKPVIIDILRNNVTYLSKDGIWHEKSLGIEIIPFLALNTQVIKLLDYKNLPNIRLPSLKMCNNLEPVIGFNDDFFIKFESV